MGNDRAKKSMLDIFHDEKEALELARNEYIASQDVLTLMVAIERICSLYEELVGEDTQWVVNATNGLLGSRCKTRNEKFQMGLYVAHLVHWGSSKNQAIKAVAKWNIISETKVRDAYYWLPSVFDLDKKEHMEEFIYDENLDLMICNPNLSRPFPRDYEKAFVAFLMVGMNYFNHKIKFFSCCLEFNGFNPEMLEKAPNVLEGTLLNKMVHLENLMSSDSIEEKIGVYSEGLVKSYQSFKKYAGFADLNEMQEYFER